MTKKINVAKILVSIIENCVLDSYKRVKPCAFLYEHRGQVYIYVSKPRIWLFWQNTFFWGKASEIHLLPESFCVLRKNNHHDLNKCTNILFWRWNWTYRVCVGHCGRHVVGMCVFAMSGSILTPHGMTIIVRTMI